MKSRPTQFGVRENTASLRQHVPRLAMNASVLQSDPLPAAERPDESTHEPVPPIKETFELSLTEPCKGATWEGESRPITSARLSAEDVGKMTVGLADSVDGKRRALLVTDVAELLSISERQVYKLVAAHRIPCFKIGGSIRFDPSAISAWLRQKMAPAAAEHLRERRART